MPEQADGYKSAKKKCMVELRELIQEMRAGLAAMNRRFEDMQKQMNLRFEAVDKRFALLQWTMLLISQ